VNRTIFPFFIFWLIPCFIATIWLGLIGIFLIIFGIMAVIAGWGLYGIYYLLNGYWILFNREEPSDDIIIIQRLKGIKKEDRLNEYYID
jgi:hypothetical protein